MFRVTKSLKFEVPVRHDRTNLVHLPSEALAILEVSWLPFRNK